MASSARIEELRKKFEENPRRYFAPLANEYRKAGDIDQAIAICREYLPQQPGHMSGHIVYGQALFEARQVEEAKTVFETALSLDPENLIALRHLGDLALLVGDSQGARTWYGRVLEADPRNEEIQAQLAALDHSASAAPTPVATASIAATPPPTPPPAPAKPTPSSAPTVVMSAPAKPQPWAAAKRAPVEQPREAVTAQSPTAEIKLDTLPTASHQETEKSQDMTIGLEPTSFSPPSQSATAATLEIDVPASASTEAPSLDSFSLEGLETTSLSAAPPPSDPPATAAPMPLADLDFGAPAEVPAPPAVSLPVAEPAQDLPLLDIGEIPSAPVASAPPAAPLRETPSEPIADEAPAVPESGPFVTETMAELYLQQGHREEALRVYRALLDQRPDDASLMAKVAALSPPAAPVAHAGPTIRELLNAIAVRRPGFRPEPPRENGAAALASPASPEASPEPSPADALTALFGSVQIAEADEGAAIALAYAFMDLNGFESGSAASQQISGAPARHATNELSLDAVFKSSEAPQQVAPSSFSFDQFFSQRATSEHAVQSGVPAASGGESRDDVAQFAQWLEGLKRR